jgi:RNA polymerase sigma-70 factor (ECF subfamily)
LAAPDSADPDVVDDADLPERFRRGDQVAFLEVYREHEDRIRGLAQRFFALRIEQEEAAQEIWLLAHRMRHGYDPARGPVAGWLFTLATNRCRQLLRDKGRRPPSAGELGADQDGERAGEAGDPDAATAAPLRQAVTRFVGRLTPEEARFVRLAFVDELTNPELAEALHISERRCKYLRRKLLARAAEDAAIRALLEDEGSRA